MKLTAFTDYSLRVLIYLAANPAKKATIAEVSRVFGVSEHHLMKVVHFLGKKGWISTLRGKGGGMSLGKAARNICIGQVVRDTEGYLAPAECFEAGGGHCTIGQCCQLKDVLADAIKAFYAVLDRYTVADVASNQEELARVLNFYRSLPSPHEA